MPGSGVTGVRGVIHAASWVSLGPDSRGESQATNVESTRHLLTDAAAAGAERFVYTSTLYSLAAGTREQPADEMTKWNLHDLDSDYTRTKRQAEQLVLAANRPGFSTIALCPGMVQGPAIRNRLRRQLPRPTHARSSPSFRPGVYRSLMSSYWPWRIVGAGLRRGGWALRCGRALSELRRSRRIGRFFDGPPAVAESRYQIGWNPWLSRLRVGPVHSPVAGGPTYRGSLPPEGSFDFSCRGDKANACFGLVHPPAIDSIAKSL